MHLINDLIFLMRRRFQMPLVGRQILAVAQGRIASVPRDQSYVNGAARIVAP